jgi:hypothetical protein
MLDVSGARVSRLRAGSRDSTAHLASTAHFRGGVSSFNLRNFVDSTAGIAHSLDGQLKCCEVDYTHKLGAHTTVGGPELKIS